MVITIDGAKMKAFLLERLKERSTWLGIIALLAGAGATVSPDMSEMIVATGSTIAGLILMLTSDEKKVASDEKLGAGTN